MDCSSNSSWGRGDDEDLTVLTIDLSPRPPPALQLIQGPDRLEKWTVARPRIREREDRRERERSPSALSKPSKCAIRSFLLQLGSNVYCIQKELCLRRSAKERRGRRRKKREREKDEKKTWQRRMERETGESGKKREGENGTKQRQKKAREA